MKSLLGETTEEPQHRLGDSILIRSPNWLGDAVMTFPAVRCFLNKLPAGAQVSILTPAKLKPLWELFPGIHSILSSDPNLVLTSSMIREGGFTSTIIFPNSPRTALEPWLAGVPYRYGFRGKKRSFLLTHFREKGRPDHGLRHQKDDYLDLITGLMGQAVEFSEKDAFLKTPPRPEVKGPYLVLCPGAEYGPAKRWLPERFAEVAKQLASENGFEIFLLGTEGDEEAGRLVASGLDRCSNWIGKTDLATFLGFLAHADFVLCNDSGAMHVAAAFRRPGVAIFGSTEPKLTGPISDSVRVVREHVPCSPCFLRECPLDFRCMERISAAEVVTAAKTVLNNA